MIRNFFKIAIRNILKHKVFSFINVAGLAIGLAASLLILLWVEDELSYEKFNSDAENIYRVEEDQFYSGERYHVTVTPYPSGPEWQRRIPEITDQTRVHPWLPRTLFRNGDKVFFEPGLMAGDSTFFRIFSFPFLAGDPKSALTAPGSIVISEKLAMKYFGERNPVGKSLTLENKYRFTVTGVLKKLPRNSMFKFEAIVPFSFLKDIGRIYDGWSSNSYFTYVHLQQGADTSAVNKKMTEIVVEHDPQITTKYLLFPLLDIHLHQQFGFRENNGPVIVVTIFVLIAIFVIIIASINFINLSTARAALRSREIGIKKVAGADRASMIVQFMLESLLLVTASMLLALIMVGLALPVFNSVSGKTFVLADLKQAKFILSFIAVGLVAAIMSGIYPALYLSSFKPVAVLKGDMGTGKGNGRMRQILVVVQFSLSMLIAISSTFMYLQLKYMINKELGYNKNNLMSILMVGDTKKGYYALKKGLENEPLIEGVTGSLWSPVNIGSNGGGAKWEGKDPDRNVLIGTDYVDYNYLKTMKMELISGRDFSKEYSSDFVRDTTGNFLINEEAARVMGMIDPVGKKFSFMGHSGRIVGVMKDFHFKGADEAIEPVAFSLGDTSAFNFMLIRLTPGNVPGSIKAVERVWKDVIPDYPLEYTFIDQDYENIFRSQIRLTELLRYFTVLAVIIACLGLYGLASFATERRTNEVGIRKVMGAGSLIIMYNLIREFLVFVLIAIVISVPLGWYVVTRLLGQFAYRIGINPIVFALIAAGAVMIAVFTVGFQAYKATGINPAEALKVE